MSNRTVDVSEMDLVEALRVNFRRLAISDVRAMLREAADEIEKLRREISQREAEYLEGGDHA